MSQLVVIGAMKCGTSALRRYLAAHPDVSVPEAPAELNFFFGPETPTDPDPDTWWREGQWHRGSEWYAALFDPGAAVRVDVSPGYTDPGHPEVAARMAGLAPDARLVYLVRDPVARAASQWRHHRRDGTEHRPLAEALPDPDSQYVARSRYHDRLRPFLEHFPPEQLLVVVQERLLADRRGQLARVHTHAGVEPWWHESFVERVHVGGDDVDVPAAVRQELTERVADDTARLAELVDDLPW